MRKYEYRIHTEFKQFDVIQEFDCEPNKVQDYIRRYINQNTLWLSFEQPNQKVIYWEFDFTTIAELARNAGFGLHFLLFRGCSTGCRSKRSTSALS